MSEEITETEEKIFDPDNPGADQYLLQFNKITNIFTGCYTVVPLETLNTENYLYVKEMFDPVGDVVIGTYPNYTIERAVDQPTKMTEATMDALAEEKINKLYPQYTQLNILGSAIQKLLDAVGEEDEALTEMLDYINEVRNANNIRKEAYEANEDFNYITKEQDQQELYDRLEGGVHELSGPREVEVNFSNVG